MENAHIDVARNPRTRYRFAVTVRPRADVRGRVTLSLLNESIREWEIVRAVHPDWWGRGLATEAALRVLEKLRMQWKGVLRESRQQVSRLLGHARIDMTYKYVPKGFSGEGTGPEK